MQLIQLLDKHNLEICNHNIGKENVSPLGLLADNTVCLLTSVTQDSWVIDTKASDRITPHYSLLNLAQALSYSCSITMPNGKQATVTQIGSILIGHDIELQ